MTLLKFTFNHSFKIPSVLFLQNEHQLFLIVISLIVDTKSFLQTLQLNIYFECALLKICLGIKLFLFDQNLLLGCEANELLKHSVQLLFSHNF